jgi:hypothetical protein
MANIKPTAKMFADAIGRLSELKKYKEQYLIMVQGKDTPFWQALKYNLKTVVDGANQLVSNQLDSNLVGEPASEYAILRAYRASAKTAQDLIDQVERPESYLAQLDYKISELQKKVDEMREQEKEGVFSA